MTKTNKINSTKQRSPQLFIAALAIVSFVILPKLQEGYHGWFWLGSLISLVIARETFRIKSMVNVAAKLVNAVNAVLSYDPKLLLLKKNPILKTIFPLYPRQLIKSEKMSVNLNRVQQKKTERRWLEIKFLL